MAKRMSIGYVPQELDDNPGINQYTQYIGRIVTVGVRGMGVAKGRVEQIVNGEMLLQKDDRPNNPPIRISIKDIAMLEPKTIIPVRY